MKALSSAKFMKITSLENLYAYSIALTAAYLYMHIALVRISQCSYIYYITGNYSTVHVQIIVDPQKFNSQNL